MDIRRVSRRVELRRAVNTNRGLLTPRAPSVAPAATAEPRSRSSRHLGLIQRRARKREKAGNFQCISRAADAPSPFIHSTLGPGGLLKAELTARKSRGREEDDLQVTRGRPKYTLRGQPAAPKFN